MLNKILYEDIEELANDPLWSEFAGQTILVSGATGLLGANTALSAIRANEKHGYDIKVTAVCRDISKAKKIYSRSPIEFLFQDIREPLKFNEGIDYFFHFAGSVGPNVFSSNPTEVLSGNAAGTLNLLDYAVKHGCKSFAFSSTHEVYGNVTGECSEETPLVLSSSVDSRSCYVLGKQFGENALACYAKQFELKTVSLRFSRLIGGWMNIDSGLFICDFIKNKLNAVPIRISGNVNLLRPLTYVTDAVRATLYGILRGESGQAFNVQSDELPVIYEIARLISDDVFIAFSEKTTGEKIGHWLNCDKLKRLGWKQRVPLESGLKRTLECFKYTIC